jgi:hypothetical protein
MIIDPAARTAGVLALIRSSLLHREQVVAPAQDGTGRLDKTSPRDHVFNLILLSYFLS